MFTTRKYLEGEDVSESLSKTIKCLNKELEWKRLEVEQYRKEIKELNELLSNTVYQYKLLSAENKKLKYASNEFKRMGVIEERDRLTQHVHILQSQLKEMKATR